MNKKLVKLLSILIMVVMIGLTLNSVVLATSRPSDIVAQANDSDPKVKAAGGKILGVITTVAVVAAVIVIAILGIKYIIGSTEEKAGYKKAFMPYIVGLLLVAAASKIADLIWNASSNLFS